MPHRRSVRPGTLAVLLLLVAAASGGCTGPASEYETASNACRELTAVTEPYAARSTTPPFDLLPPTNAPEQWREDAEAVREAAGPLLEFEGTPSDRSRLPEFGERWVAFAEYLTRTSRDPDDYDTDTAAGLLYPAQGICSDAIEEAA